MEKIKKNKSKFFAVVLFLFIFVSGCSYTANRILPENIRNINVSMFLNKTLKYRLENLLSDAIIEELIMDGRLKVVEQSESDCSLSGEIVQFLKQPVNTDRSNNVLENKLTLIINIILKDKKGNVILEKKNISESYNYPERQSEQDAMVRLIKNLSRKIVIQIIEKE
ncbi:hypothetical protein HY745_14205 [Candidatus Desantisbacteria bacterium]|nr:hypothetical protein [Candidatus Desantisbacteria bacterium]